MSRAAGASTLQVALVGAGVIGLSAAYHLVEKYGEAVSVTVVADKFSPDTTSDKAGSFILPVDFADDKHGAGTDIRIRQWTEDTFRLFHRLYASEVASDIDLCLVNGYYCTSEVLSDPWWKEQVFSYRRVEHDSVEKEILHVPPSCKTIISFSTYNITCSRYLPWLMREFVRKGGRVKEKRLVSLDELNNYDVIVNCCGLGARELVGDKEIRPVRGQVVVVEAPWIKHFAIQSTDPVNMTYIVPRSNVLLLGGTAQEGDWNETVDDATTQAIISRCSSIIPSLRKAKVIGGWAGGRPLLNSTRLEEEWRAGRPPVIHCYGHGGQGVTLHWGCALEVGRMVGKHLRTAGVLSRL